MKKLKSINFWMLISILCIASACEVDPIVRNPIAHFNFTVAEDGLTVAFENLSKDAISYSWNFGDGQTSTEKTPTHVYAADGTYTVKLVATGDTGASAEWSKEVTVKEDPKNVVVFEIRREASLGYTGTVITLTDEHKAAIADELELSFDEIAASLIAWDDVVTFQAVEGETLYDGPYTANGYGHWFDGDGNVINWGANARAYSEFSEATFEFAIGHFPDQAVAGDKITIKQALVRGDKQFTFVFEITIE